LIKTGDYIMPKPVIMSADGKLQIVRHSMVYPPMGPKCVQGAVKNISSENAEAKIKVDFLNEAGELLGSSIGVFKDIKPGESRLFDIWGERLPNSWEVEEHNISFVE
jgi:hypothetical protein